MKRALEGFLVLVALAGLLAAAEPGPGKTVEVTCKGKPAQKYSCYVPKAYTPSKSWPILYCFSPNARGDAFVQRYRNVCEELGWIVVGSMNSRNGPWEPIQEAIAAMWADTAERFNLSKTMRYASGFSGGARVSFAVAGMHLEVSGVIAIGAGLPSGGPMPRKELAVWLMCGEGDPNKRELDPLSERMRKEGFKVEYENFPGGHVMPPVPLMEKAARWMDAQAVERKVQQLTQAFDAAQGLVEEGKPVEAYFGLTDALARCAEAELDRGKFERLLKTLARDPAVKRELSAMKKYDAARAWEEKNRDRIQKYDSARAQAMRKYREVVDRYPDTRAAARAEARNKALDAEGG